MSLDYLDDSSSLDSRAGVVNITLVP